MSNSTAQVLFALNESGIDHVVHTRVEYCVNGHRVNITEDDGWLNIVVCDEYARILNTITIAYPTPEILRALLPVL